MRSVTSIDTEVFLLLIPPLLPLTFDPKNCFHFLEQGDNIVCSVLKSHCNIVTLKDRVVLDGLRKWTWKNIHTIFIFGKNTTGSVIWFLSTVTATFAGQLCLLQEVEILRDLLVGSKGNKTIDTGNSLCQYW